MSAETIQKRVILFDSNGVAMAVENGVAIPVGTLGLLIAGSDGTNARFATVKAPSTAAVAADPALVVTFSPNSGGGPFAFGGDNRLKVGVDTVTFFDTFDGAAVNLINWAQSQSGMTQTVSSAGVLLNAAGSLTSGNYSILTTNKLIRSTAEMIAYFQIRTRIITRPNSVIEFGWLTMATTAAPTDGVFLRVDSTGTLIGVINFGGTETTVTLIVAGGFNSTNYYTFELEIEEGSVTFEVYQAAVIIATQTIMIAATQAAIVAVTTQPISARVRNSALVTAPAAQLYISNCIATASDSGPVFADYSNVTSVASSAANVTLLAANLNRKAVVIFNDSNQILYVKLGVTASLTSFTYRVTPNATLELPPVLPTGQPWVGQIDGIWASANGSARITEQM